MIILFHNHVLLKQVIVSVHDLYTWAYEIG